MHESRKWLAHISDDGENREQTVLEHLSDTAFLAGELAGKFGGAKWGRLCGMLHDIGKYTNGFQKRLEGGSRVDHSTAGAVELLTNHKYKGRKAALLAAFCVAGHHSGLPDAGTLVGTCSEKSLFGRLKKKLENYQAYRGEVELPEFPGAVPVKPIGKYGGFTLAFFTRMLFSSLVDADYLDTEQFMKQKMLKNNIEKRGNYDSVETLWNRLCEKKITPFLEAGEQKEKPLNAKRTEILKQCIKAAKMQQGLYSLTVPTGGGKTLSSLAFALLHALENRMERVIYVIPYTSIIEQNAEVFRDILGDKNVLEHHHNAEYQDKMEEKDVLDQQDYSEERGMALRLAAENWDIPVVVTTNVQFFESLYGNRPSKCRKLHNIANSVVIFDEAQMLPNEYLLPCIRAIKELVCNYHTTAVLCTATQPSIQEYFKEELSCHEICLDPEGLYQFFKRTNLVNAGEYIEDELVEKLEQNESVLCILNNRKRVQSVYGKLKKQEGNYHLSTLMYPEHRKAVLNEIKWRLKEKLPCRVIATSVVEAGVDLDFQTVYRELAGLDSVIQAAGRCNREGDASAEESCVYVFTLPEEPGMKLPNSLSQPVGISRGIMEEYEDMASLLAIEDYFKGLHHIKGESLDQKKIVDQFELERNAHFKFAEVAKEFRLIEPPTKLVLIEKEEEAQKIAEDLRKGIRSRELFRKMGCYSISLSCRAEGEPEKTMRDYELLEGAGMLERLDEEITILGNTSQYDADMGLKLDICRGDALFS